MFNNYNLKVENKTTTVNNTIVPEDINLNIRKSNETSFFLEVNRNTEQYKVLLQELPVLLEKEFIKYKEEDYMYDEYVTKMRKKVEGGYDKINKIPVKVLSINYSGEGNFIFELIKL